MSEQENGPSPEEIEEANKFNAMVDDDKLSRDEASHSLEKDKTPEEVEAEKEAMEKVIDPFDGQPWIYHYPGFTGSPSTIFSFEDIMHYGIVSRRLRNKTWKKFGKPLLFRSFTGDYPHSSRAKGVSVLSPMETKDDDQQAITPAHIEKFAKYINHEDQTYGAYDPIGLFINKDVPTWRKSGYEMPKSSVWELEDLTIRGIKPDEIIGVRIGQDILNYTFNNLPPSGFQKGPGSYPALYDRMDKFGLISDEDRKKAEGLPNEDRTEKISDERIRNPYKEAVIKSVITRILEEKYGLQFSDETTVQDYFIALCKKNRIPLYSADYSVADSKGQLTLVWPRQMTYEEIRQFVAERKAKKRQEEISKPENG